METFELRYFVAAARLEGVHAASRSLSISPGSVSKAIARLEDELGVLLFQREGRGIRLTDQGRALLDRASTFLALEASIRADISGKGAEVRHVVVGAESLLAGYGPNLAAAASNQVHTRFAFQSVAGDHEAYEALTRGEAAFALTASSPPSHVTAKPLGRALFQTFVGKGHALYAAAQRGTKIRIEAVLTHAFGTLLSPSHGRLADRLSLDGWSDDLHPRHFALESSSLSVLMTAALAGRVLVHAPAFLAAGTSLAALEIEGCASSCHLDVRLAAKPIPYGPLLEELAP